VAVIEAVKLESRPHTREMALGLQPLRRQLLQDGCVVKNPEPPAMRTENHVVFPRMHDDVVNGHRRQVVPERHPRPAAGDRREHTELGADQE
jgi:hypothetical protein